MTKQNLMKVSYQGNKSPADFKYGRKEVRDPLPRQPLSTAACGWNLLAKKVPINFKNNE